VKSICRNFFIVIGILILSWQLSFAQERNPTEWPYGGVPDESRKKEWMYRPPLNFHSNANFRDATFDSTAYFGEAKFDNTADFRGTIFSQFVGFRETRFSQYADFRVSEFSQYADFRRAKFDSTADFREVIFSQDADFREATFSQDADFRDATFSQGADFRDATFKEIPLMERCQVGKILDLSAVNFEKGMDFRGAIFDSVGIIYIDHHTTFPTGECWLYWDQFKAKETLRIRLHPVPSVSVKERETPFSVFPVKEPYSVKEQYLRLETFYHRLRDNYLALGDKNSADAVMFELGWQKREIVGGLWQTVYGWFFGWGYQPWRFLVFVVVPIIIGFAFLWYFRYYNVLQYVIFREQLEHASAVKIHKERVFQKIWHSVFFSASALLGIRFKKDWFIDYKNFLVWASLEWVIGIGLYITFAVLVKSNQFAYIKGLLGF
jgi:uncharacterized protein YjbI with pentapeptide repeats